MEPWPQTAQSRLQDEWLLIVPSSKAPRCLPLPTCVVAKPWRKHGTSLIRIPLLEGLVCIRCLHLSGLCREAWLSVWVSIGSLNLLEIFSILKEFPGAGRFGLMARQVSHWSRNCFRASCENHRLVSYRSLSLHRTLFLLSSPQPRVRPKPWTGALFFSVSRSGVHQVRCIPFCITIATRSGLVWKMRGKGKKIWKRALQIRDGCFSLSWWQAAREWHRSVPLRGLREATQELQLTSIFRTKRKGWGRGTGIDWLYIEPLEPSRW